MSEERENVSAVVDMARIVVNEFSDKGYECLMESVIRARTCLLQAESDLRWNRLSQAREKAESIILSLENEWELKKSEKEVQ